MDQTLKSIAENPIVVTGVGSEIHPALWDYLNGNRDRVEPSDLIHDCRPFDYLRSHKALKLMSKQDRLAVSAAGKALHMSKIADTHLAPECGVFISVGYIPFEKNKIATICENSVENNKFSMHKFSTDAFRKINPMLIFQCLPNMPAHHITANFNLQGEYMITYPDTRQLYSAFIESVWALIEDRATMALVGGVADQNNFLVENHFMKEWPDRSVCAADGAAFFIIEREKHAIARGVKSLMRLKNIADNPDDQASSLNTFDIEWGPIELPLMMAWFLEQQKNTAKKIFTHLFKHSTGTGGSQWERM